MRKINLIGILVVVLFLLPMVNLSSDYSPAATVSNPYLPQTTDTSPFTVSSDHSTGVGPALPVTISGQVSNAGQGTLSFDSSSSGIGSVTLEDGWTGTDLQAQIDSLTWTAEDVLTNGDLNAQHNELFIVTTNPGNNDEPIPVPDGWTIIKDVIDDYSEHPKHGYYEMVGNPNGNGGTWGAFLEVQLDSDYSADPNDEMYIGQMVSIPYREVYSAQVSFSYRVRSDSTLDDKVHLFIRLAGYTEKFHVFESGDTTNTWLTESVTIPASSMPGLSANVLQFDIGFATDGSGDLGVSDAFAYIDDIEMDLVVRPFPEQIDLKANGTLVWGSTSHSTYPYVPDDDNRDCYDDESLGIDFDGYTNTGELETGMYSSGFNIGTLFETGMQFPLDVPQGAIITSAFVEVEAVTSSSPYLLGMRVHVADEDNVSAFTTGLPHLEDRFNWVETSVDWSLNSWFINADTRYRSPEIAPLIQNVVSRPLWQEGNYVCVMTSLMYSDYYQRWNSIKGSSGYDGEDLARLFVEYVIPEPEDTVILFDYQREITIDHLDVVSDLTDFPVLIDFTHTDLRDNVLSNGNDIAFSVGGTPVAHEIELYDQLSGHLVAWVKVPFLSSSIDTVITMHYGSANAPPNLGSRVWDNYEIVQHLNEDPTGINYDSTSNSHDGTSYGNLGTSDLVSGQIGNAVDFDGSGDFISVGQIYTDEWSEFSVSAWVAQSHYGISDDRIFSKAQSTSTSQAIIHLAIDDTHLMRIRLGTDGTGGSLSTSIDGTTVMSELTWYHLTFTWNAATATIDLYLNGNLENSVGKDGDSVRDSDTMFVIGNWGAVQTDNRYFNGSIDEIRLLPTALSAAWIETEFNNQNNPSGFYTVGTQRNTVDTWTDASEPGVHFTTSSPGIVSMDVIITMDVGGEAQTMDTDFNEGVSYFIETGASIVNWTAKVMVSPPAGATSFGFSVEYPRAEWKATTVLNPMNQPKTLGTDWWYHGGTLTLNASAIDFWGVWTLKFISWNFLEDIQINSTAFNVGEIAQFTMTTPTVYGAYIGLDLVDPDGITRDSQYAATTTDPSHRFPSFKYRKDLTISSSVVYGDLIDFPVLIQFTDTDLHDTSRVRADGSDILFAMGDTILDHEIEYFNRNYTGSEARISAWVKANLSASSTNTITMYYGSPVIDNLENPAGVWSSDFEAVWHLDEDVVDESSGAIHYDSSGNDYNGVQYGNVEYLFGRAGYGQTFDGVDDYISFDETLTPSGDLFITGWFQLDSGHDANSPNTKVILEKYIDINHDLVIALAGQDYGQNSMNGSLVFKVESSTNSAMYKYTSTITNWDTGWYFIACYADEDAPDNNAIWVDSGPTWVTTGKVGSTTQANASYIEEWRLGGGDYDSGVVGTGWFGGNLDEFRVGTSLRSAEWLRTENRNQGTPSSFAVPGIEQMRTPPSHTITKAIDSTAPAGQWTAIAHYNDTGTSVTNKTGLFERTFIVRHDTLLTLNKPTDAVGDRLSVKTAGDSIIVEYELSDAITALGVPGATVTMNWTSPSTITLDDYGAGLYGKVLDTTNLGDNKQWRVEVQSSHPYYNDANEYFNVDLYHATTLSAAGGSTTPADFIFNTTLTFEDDFTGAPISGAIITESDGSPVSFVDNLDGTYDVSIPTTALSLVLHQYTFNATKSGAYLHVAQVDVEFTLRAHYTSVFVQGDLNTPHGENTQVTIFLFDLDTGDKVSFADVGTMTFNYSGPYADDTVDLYVGWITSNDWDVGTVTATLTITLSEPRILAPLPYVFDIEIIAHDTTVTVTGATTKPYGNQTDLSIILTDLETGGIVPIGSVSDIELQHPFGTYVNDSSYSFTLDTSSWTVGTHTVTIVVAMSSTIYSAPTNYQFDITIRSMTSVMYHGPSTLNFTIGSDFTVNLHLNVSEDGQYHGDPVTGRIAGEFSVPGYVISIDTSQQAIGLYRLTIDQSYFTGGSYQITVYFTSTDNMYDDTSLIIQFSYREIVSYLSSPNYPQVTTPYQVDVEIILEYADADFGSGIAGATISSPDHPSWIANWTDETGGFYSVWIDVSTLAKGTHFISLTADRSGFTARTLEFRIEIRDAYTSATPLVGSLDIPIGNSPSFLVDYLDLDRLLPIENLTSPYTQVISTWGNFSVEYISGTQQYEITFHTSDSDTIAQNQVYTFTFTKSNYQTAQFSITMSIRTHNTDFRIVSSIEPTSTTGIFNISVYYGDLDNALGIKSALVVFSVSNDSGPVSSSYDYDLVLGDGFYIIQVPASQFGLGLQTFTVYADWTGVVLKYQDKLFATSANVVGKESALTLLIGSEPTPYNEDMSYTFFYSDLFSGIGIDNLTNNVFIYVSFQGEPVSPSDIIITDFSATEIGKYSIEFNSGIFSRTGLIYMNVFVNWSKGVSPFYSNRTDVISVRILPRDTLLSFTPPSSTSFDENATLTLTFEDITGGSSSLITSLTKQEISLNISFSYTEDAGVYEISFNTNQFGSLGTKAILIDVTWVGSPFYANRTGRITYINVIERETYLEYLTPPPTQYDDQVVFNVTWTDILSSNAITSASLLLLEGATPINPSEYAYQEIAPGIYQVTLNTTYATNPETVTLRVKMSATEFYYSDRTIDRQFTIRERATILAVNPITDVPYNSSIIITLSYLDLFTGQTIDNTSLNGYPVSIEVLSPSGAIFTSSWIAISQDYRVVIAWDPSWNPALWAPGTVHPFTIRMSYAFTAPFYESKQVSGTFEIRIRESTLSLDSEPETTPYLDDVSFTVFYSDDDADDSGVDGAQITVLNNSIPLVENTHYTLTEGSPGYYTIVVDSTALGGLGPHTLEIQMSWTGAPYHEGVTRDVNVLIRQRETNLEITVPPSQTLYLDDVTFTFVFNDIDGLSSITLTDLSIIHIYLPGMIEIDSGDYTLNQVGSLIEVTVSSTILSASPVVGLSVNVTIDWDIGLAPYYSDDSTIVKITITGRSILVETDQIERTPKGDLLNISITLSDLDNLNPITGAIIQFSCQGHSLVEGVDYTYTPSVGVYSYNINTASLIGTGTFFFDVTVEWDPALSPFYSNRTTNTLLGLVDLIRTSLQVNVIVPSSVQYTDDVSLNLTWTDLDHGGPVSGYELQIQSAVEYLLSGLPPVSLSVVEYGSSGVYNISFSTNDPGISLGSYTLVITASGGFYESATVTPQFSVIEIITELTPWKTSDVYNWTDMAYIEVDYRNLLDDTLIPGAVVSWSIGAVFGAYLDPTGTPGQYYADIPTLGLGSGYIGLTITASRNQYAIATTTIRLDILPLPSEIIRIDPIKDVFLRDRGSEINISVFLNDTYNIMEINNLQVIGNVTVDFEGQQFDLVYNPFSSYWEGAIPGSATVLTPDTYDIRITVLFDDYNPATYSLLVRITEAITEFQVINAGGDRINAVFTEMVTFRLNFTAPEVQLQIDDARVYWFQGNWTNDVDLTHIGGGIYELTFDTSDGAYGTYGLVFRGIPTDPVYASARVSITLTISKITTRVVAPPVPPVNIWGWQGYISLYYNDTSFNTGIANATATYSYGFGPISNVVFNATDLGNGTYLVYIDTTLLTPNPNTRYTILISFEKENYDERVQGVELLVLERPTEVVVLSPEYNQIAENPLALQLPMGDILNITFFYNDTSTIGGLYGGIASATFGSRTLFAGPSFGGERDLSVFEIGNGYYYFIFDTTDANLYNRTNGLPALYPDRVYDFTIEIYSTNRTRIVTVITIEVIEVLTDYVLDIPPDLEMVHGDTLEFRIYVNDTWHNRPVLGASITGEFDPAVVIFENGTTNDGWYYVMLRADGVDSSGLIDITISLDFHATITLTISAHSTPNDTDILIGQVTQIGLPISLLVITLLGLYVRVWSVPKRIRQINGQLKALRKGKVPKPIKDVKSRQKLAAELFNDTFEEMKITRLATQMPEDPIPIEVPEMGELLTQLSILTNLSAEELDEFQADIVKMKMSEQAAFVKEVIMQEAIRAARRDGRTVEETLAAVEQDALRRLGGEEEVKPIEVVDVEPDERVFLEEEKKVKVTPKDEVTPVVDDKIEEVSEEPSDKMSLFEIEELRKDLERKGVPPHEIETIIEQAKELPRELIDELVKSLEGKKD